MLEKLYPKKINVWKNGNYGISVQNGVYKTSSTATCRAFVVQGDELQSTLNAQNMAYTLVSENKIDFSEYSTVKVVESNTGTTTLNVSGYNGEGYLCVYSFDNQTQTRGICVCIASDKNNFETNIIDNLTAFTVHSSVYSSVTEIVVE